ncbi:YcgJ family protein [Photobacterium kagoshimensis]|uniref:YcgJ family protein n=1 Tax=Photobacterium kagoshimensis TaxID=2910242 RepID=UPI003D0DB087
MKIIKHLVRSTLVLVTACFTFLTFAANENLQSAEPSIQSDSASSTASSIRLAEGIYSPEHGIICDQNAGFCVDEFGISMAFTQSFLGDDAQNKMLKMIEQVGGSDNFDSSRFSFSNKVYCDSTEGRCFDDRYSETQQAQFTEILFTEEE